MKYVLTNNHRNVSNNDLLDDIKEVAKKLQKCTLTVAEYNKNGKYSPNTFYRRFGSWAKVLEQAGLDIDFKNNGKNGIEFAKDLRKINKNFFLVFLSAHQRNWVLCNFKNCRKWRCGVYHIRRVVCGMDSDHIFPCVTRNRFCNQGTATSS